MAEEMLGSLCESLVSKLEDLSCDDHEGSRFFYKGTAKEVFSSNQKKLRHLLSLILDIPITDQLRLSEEAIRVISSFSTILAILLYSRKDHLLVQQYKQVRDSPPFLTDDDLPFTRASARLVFQQQGDAFYENQFPFCPVVLKKAGEVTYADERSRCPLPYLEQNYVDAGAFGTVRKVKIAKHHLQDGKGTANIEALAYARKDFVISRELSFRTELKNLREIMDQQQPHASITLPEASLRHGSVYSIFFPLADGNLWNYLHGEGGFQTSLPLSFNEKSRVFRRGVDLVGALGFLHDGLRSKNFEDISCYHLDLKPQNVLVFNAGSSSEVWKITDFGIARIKQKDENDRRTLKHHLGSLGLGTSILREISTLNPGGAGTYLPPEYHHIIGDGRATSSSDIWSYGCIFSLVMSFIDGGPEAVRKFDDKRANINAGSGHFYFVKKDKAQLSKAVVDWFSRLTNNSRRTQAEFNVFSRTLEFLKKHVLNVDRSSRKDAITIQQELTEIGKYFESKADAARPAKKKWPFGIGKPSLPEFKIQGMNACMFSHCGKFLAFCSSEKVVVFEVNSIRKDAEAKPVLDWPVNNYSRDRLIITSAYLCASPSASDCFECHISPLPRDSSASASTGRLHPTKIRYSNIQPIQNIAMSTNGELGAFVVSNPGNSQEWKVHLFNTQEMIDTATNSRRSCSQSSASNSTPGSDASSIGTNVLLRTFEIGSIYQVFKLMFSPNGLYLLVVAQTPDRNLILIKAWNTYSGDECTQITIPGRVSSISLEYMFTACTMFDSGPYIVLLLQCRYLVVIESWRHLRHCELDDHYLDMFARDKGGDEGEDGSLVLIGGNSSKGVQKFYELPISSTRLARVKGSKKIDKTEISHYETSTDSAVLTIGDENTRNLLVAKKDGTLLAIELPEPN